MHRTTSALAAGALTAALCVTLSPAHGQGRPGPPRLTGGSDTIVNSGACSAGSSWTLSGRSRFLRVAVEAVVQTGGSRQRWVLQVRQNQTTVTRVARRPSGSGVVKVRGRVRNLPGPDTFTFTARNRRTSEICQGTLTF